jgi:hypothetical protein
MAVLCLLNLHGHMACGGSVVVSTSKAKSKPTAVKGGQKARGSEGGVNEQALTYMGLLVACALVCTLARISALAQAACSGVCWVLLFWHSTVSDRLLSR